MTADGLVEPEPAMEAAPRPIDGLPAELAGRLVVVTGGSGFLGRHVCAALVAAGAHVRSIDLAPPGPLPGPVEHVRTDVADGATVARALRGADAVVHAAYAAPRLPEDRLRAVNVEGTRNVCRAAREAGARRLVVVSSTIVERPPSTSGHRRGLTRLEAYRASRSEAERLALGAAGPDLSVAVVRPKTLVGPGQVGAFALVFEMIRTGAVVPVPGRGSHRYQLLDVRDLCAALVTLCARGEGVFRLGAGSCRPVREELVALTRHARTGATLRRVPAAPFRVLVAGMDVLGLPPLSEWYRLAALGQDSRVDTTPAQQQLGWTARSNLEALVAAYDWYAQERLAGGQVRTTHPVPASHRVLQRLAQLGRRRPPGPVTSS